MIGGIKEIDGYYRLRFAEAKGAGVEAMLEWVIVAKVALGLAEAESRATAKSQKK